MIIIACLRCLNAIRVMSLAPGEIESLFLSIPSWPVVACPTCGERAQGMNTNEVAEAVLKALTVRDLSPVEAHAAILGVGFPEEHRCDGDRLSELLKAQPFRRLVGQDIPNTDRFCVDFMELGDGSRIYFGSSTHGAVIYRISRPGSYADKVDG